MPQSYSCPWKQVNKRGKLNLNYFLHSTVMSIYDTDSVMLGNCIINANRHHAKTSPVNLSSQLCHSLYVHGIGEMGRAERF